MEKSALIFIGLLLISTCKIIFSRILCLFTFILKIIDQHTYYNLAGTQVLSKSCNKDSDCTNAKCLHVTKIKCVLNTCQCVTKRNGVLLPLQTRCNPAACDASCKSIGQEVAFYNCALDHCECRHKLPI